MPKYLLCQLLLFFLSLLRALTHDFELEVSLLFIGNCSFYDLFLTTITNNYFRVAAAKLALDLTWPEKGRASDVTK